MHLISSPPSLLRLVAAKVTGEDPAEPPVVITVLLNINNRVKLYVCMWVFICKCMCVYMYVYVCVCECVRERSIHVHLHTDIYFIQ